MKNKGYTVIKLNQEGEITLETLEKINGYQVKPKNKCNYKNIKVNSMVIIKPSFIEKVLKKKIKRKLEYYLNYIINLAGDDSDDDNCRIALGELERYKETIDYKYRKFLDDKFINLLQKKISLIEHEIKNKLQNVVKQDKRRTTIIEDEEIVEERRRRR